jgi:hypothetical protein
MRENLAAQRAEAREREQALTVLPTELSVDPDAPTWYESAVDLAADSVLTALSFAWLF